MNFICSEPKLECSRTHLGSKFPPTSSKGSSQGFRSKAKTLDRRPKFISSLAISLKPSPFERFLAARGASSLTGT